MLLARILTIVTLCALGLGAASAQTTLNVPSASYPTIQSAVNATMPGDVVIVGPGIYVENIVFPPRDFQLIGAGMGQSIIDGGANGSCMSFTQGPVTNAMVIDGFTLRNGSGDLALLDFTYRRFGGGVYINNPLALSGPSIAPTFKNCEITQNTSYHAAGIFIRFGGDVVFENCHIRNNTVTSINIHSIAIQTEYGATNPKFIDCVIENHTAPDGSTVLIRSAAEFTGCHFRNNTAWSATAINFLNPSSSTFPVELKVRNCSFTGGQSMSPSASVIWATNTAPSSIISDCLFADNLGGGMVLGGGIGNQTIRNCTFVNNKLGNSPYGVMTFGSNSTTAMDTLRVENSIFIDNTDQSGNAVDGVYMSASMTLINRNSIIETIANAPITPRPDFIDAPNKDYHLQPFSLGVNGGTITGLIPPPVFPGIFLDLDGKQRVQFGQVDMGCYEASHIAYHDSAKGRVGENSGGPYDVLQVNGSIGNILRTVTISLGTASNVSMVQPPNLPNPAGFAIFGLIGEANEQTITNVPLGIGDMTFTPCPLLSTHPALFTLTNNIGSFCPQLVVSTPTSWTSSPFPPIFFPLTLTFQGVIEESPGVYVPTNMVIYETK